MIKSLSDIKDFLSLKIVENKKKNDLSKKKKKKNSQTSREVIGTQSMGNNERSTSRPSSSRECAEAAKHISRANKRCNSRFILPHVSPSLKEIKA